MSESVQIVKDGYANFLSGNIEGVLGVFADEFTFSVPGAPEIPYAGTKRTREELLSFFQDLDTLVQFSVFEPREYVAAGDRVVAIGRYAGQVKQSGHNFEGDWAMAWTIRDGKVVDFQEYSDPTSIKAGFVAAG